jgi:hypothetical protein
MVRVPVAFAVLAILARTAAAQTPTVGVFLDFDSVPGKVPVEVMKKEVDTLLKNSGVALDWKMAGDPTGRQSFDGLVVLKFHGKCRVESWQDGDTASGTRTLGETVVDDGHVLPFTEVKCDAVRQALRYLRPEANQGEKQKALGLAMGRVVAHELYHILARTTTHAARGLAKAAESLQDLVSGPEMPFRKEDAEAIREGVTNRVASPSSRVVD